MANEIVPPSNNLPDHANRIQDLLGGMANIANSIAEAGGVASAFPFIGINGDGIWAYGLERNAVEDGAEWAIDPRSLQHGYIAWPDQKSKERKPLGERMVPANSPLPVLASLPDVGQPYQVQFAFNMLCTVGDYSLGVTALYKNGSYGAKQLTQTLVEELRKQARKDPNNLCPVVELKIRDYFHQEWKKTIYSPELHIKRWMSFEDYDKFERAAGTPEQLPIEEPKHEPEVKKATAPPKAAATGRGRAATPPPAAAPKRRAVGRTQP